MLKSLTRYSLAAGAIAILVLSLAAQQTTASPQAGSGSAAAPGTSAAPKKPSVVTNEDVYNMVSVGVPDSTILRVISKYPNKFDIETGAQLMAAHVKMHVSTAVITAMAQGDHSPRASKALDDYLAALKDQAGTAAATGTSPAPVKGLTNQDIYDMVARKLPDATIAHIIQSSAVRFKLDSAADFDDATQHGLSLFLLGVMATASGPHSLTTGRQWLIDVKNREAAAAKARQDHLEQIRSEIRTQCPGCVAIYFYEFEIATKKHTGNTVPAQILKDIMKFYDMNYARAHHIVLTSEPAAADYQVVWSTTDYSFGYARARYDTGISSTGEMVTTSHDEPSEMTSSIYNFYVFANRGQNQTALYKARYENVGMFIGHAHPEVNCWHDVEKFLQKQHPLP